MSPILTSVPILIGKFHLEKVTFGLQEELEKKNTCCTVCLDPFTCQQDVYQLPCEHYFHKNCIVPWFLRNDTCPLCCDSNPIPDLLVQEFRRFSIPITNEDNLQYYRHNASAVCQEHGTNRFRLNFHLRARPVDPQNAPNPIPPALLYYMILQEGFPTEFANQTCGPFWISIDGVHSRPASEITL